MTGMAAVLSHDTSVNTRFIDWIWQIKGSLALAPGQSSDEAFGRLDPLFEERGTSHHRNQDTLTFTKTNQAPQDKMAVFDRGVLQIENGATGPVLHYRLTSKILLACFLAPLLFLSFAALTVTLGKLEKPAAENAAKDKAKKDDKKDKAAPQLHWIDKALGAPAPDDPKKDKDKAKDKKNDKKHSPTPAYVFACLFAALYVIGRVLEAKLVKSLFRKRLLGA